MNLLQFIKHRLRKPRAGEIWKMRDADKTVLIVDVGPGYVEYQFLPIETKKKHVHDPFAFCNFFLGIYEFNRVSDQPRKYRKHRPSHFAGVIRRKREAKCAASN